MDNQHRKISGYRELSQAEIDLMNEIKALGPQIEAVVTKARAHIEKQYDEAAGIDRVEYQRLVDADPLSCLRIGEEQLQHGLMALTRSIAQPTFF